MRLLVAGLWLLATVVAGCGSAGEGAPASSAAEGEEEASANYARVETLVLEPDAFEDMIEITGAVESVRDATISAETAGRVEKLVPLGQAVRANVRVAELDRRLATAAWNQANAAVDNASAALRLAEDSFLRIKPLYEDSIVSQQEYQEAYTRRSQSQAAFEQATAAETLARLQLDNTHILSPFAGTIEEHFVEVGEQVAPGTPVLRIVDVRSVKIAIGVPEIYAGDIAVGTPVELNFHALQGTTRPGEVTFAGNSIDPRNRTFTIEAEVSNTDGRLKPEMIADVLISRERLEDVLIVPRVAVIRDEDGNNVFVVDHSTSPPRAVRRSITLGPRYAERVVVDEGLSAGDEVIILGHQTLSEGISIEVATQYGRLNEQGIPVAN